MEKVKAKYNLSAVDLLARVCLQEGTGFLQLKPELK